MAFAAVARPLAYVDANDRVDYLKRVLLWTLGGLTLSALTGILSAVFIYVAADMGMTFLVGRLGSLVVILGSYGIAHYLAPRLVFGESKVLGFGIGAIFQGVAMGYLLLFAVAQGAAQGNPLGLVSTALVLTGLTGLGLTAYVWSSPKEFRILGAALSALFIPMLILMGVSFVFPSLFGGTLGLLLAAVFVVISAAGLLYQINKVLHLLNTDQHIEGAYLITMGVLVLYWNILTLLMRLNRR